MSVDADFHKSIIDNLHDGVYYLDPHRRITYWNRGAERISGWSADEVVGRRCADNILRHVDDSGAVLCATTCPVAKTLADGRDREVHVYLHHRDGQRVPVAVRTAPIRDGGGRVVGAVEIFDDDAERVQSKERIEELQRLALIDAVTGVGNRRFAEMTVRAKIDELDRYGWPFGALFVDLDLFKTINDTHGHDAGDAMLRAVARTIQAATRATDSVGRWGGDEFVAVCPAANAADLRVVGERVRALVADTTIDVDCETIPARASVGGAVARPGESVGELIARADDAMYRSKQGGRNRVTVDDPEG